MIIKFLLLAATIALVLVGTAQAGGLYVSEFASPDMGTAFAGAQARASDAATAIANPAGMTRLEDHQLILGFAPGFTTIEFQAAPGTPTGGTDGGDQGGLVPLVSGAYVHKISDRWRFGAGLVTISGASLDPDDNWAGRQQMTDISLLTLSIYPTLAFRATDWLSLGAGAAVTYAKMDWDLRFDGFLPGGLEADVGVSNMNDWGAAAFVGIFVQPISNVRLGMIYQSKTDLDLRGEFDGPAGLVVNARAGIPLAQFIRADVIWDVTERLALMVGGGWEDWSAAAALPISVGPIASTANIGFKDTWKIRAGIHYRLDEAWLLQAGFSYDSSAVDTADRIAALPIDRQWDVGAGAIYDWIEGNQQIGLSFYYTNLGEAPLNNSIVSGKYTTNHGFFFNVNINWKKLPWSGKLSI